jgi:16S rRNA (guanine527-N7)-methyltransferase
MVSRETLPSWLEPARVGLERFEGLLADAGVTRGLIGPREVDRLWDRHLLNCAVVADPACGLIPAGSRVADVGSGAGLPGLVWALARPDVDVVLVEPLLRRATFLSEAVEELGLGTRVTVLRARAEDVAKSAEWIPAQVVTARAVAPLDRLVGWTVPLLVPGGRLVALKGASAEEELAGARAVATEAGLVEVSVVRCGEGVVDPPTTVITGVRGTAQ